MERIAVNLALVICQQDAAQILSIFAPALGRRRHGYVFTRQLRHMPGLPQIFKRTVLFHCPIKKQLLVMNAEVAFSRISLIAPVTPPHAFAAVAKHGHIADDLFPIGAVLHVIDQMRQCNARIMLPNR